MPVQTKARGKGRKIGRKICKPAQKRYTIAMRWIRHKARNQAKNGGLKQPNLTTEVRANIVAYYS